MALDGLLLHNITNQLNELCPCKINKIQNVSDEEIALTLRTQNQGTKRVIINVHSNTNRIYIYDNAPVTQSDPSNFVMVLRKNLSQAIITSVHQAGYDRIVIFDITSRNEFGDICHFKLYGEVMGKYANIVLVSEDNIIVDALKRIPVYENSKRLIHPGAVYTLPDKPDKQNPEHVENIDLETSLVKQIDGFSPLLSREFIYRMRQSEKFEDIFQEIMESNTLYVYEKDYHCIELKHLNSTPKTYGLMEGLHHLYEKDEQKARIKEQCGDLFRTVEKEKNKNIKKLPKLKDSLAQAADYPIYREYGDLLYAYMGQVQKAPKVTLTSFETGEDVIIPIDMRFDLKDNARRYYQKYHKLKRSIDILKEQIKQCEDEIEYYTQLEQQLSYCSNQDAMEIREELINQRVLMPNKKKVRAKKKSKPNVLHLHMEDADIFIGKNNLQNNYITHQLSRKQDLWFHVKGYHGSHVLLKMIDPDEKRIRMCANLAAWFSKSSQSSSVPVDYCPISQIKKVPGSKIGFVTMQSYKTIYIDPQEADVEDWIKEYKTGA